MSERRAIATEDWVQGILRADSRAIARAITAVENREATARELLQHLFPHTGRAAIVGVTGAPGSGKSTLVDGLATALREKGHTVGILAVDPTSPFTGGALLGDRVRMQGHAGDPGIYIRSMATRGALGGLSAATFDAAMVLDAAGKEFILIETVGVGQAEVDVVKLADVTLVLLAPGAGDDVQAFKAGIMEIADIFVINKADQAGADRLEQEIRASLSVSPAPPDQQPPIVKTVATRRQGVEELLVAISAHLALSRSRGSLEQRHINRWRQRIVEILRERLIERVIPDMGEGMLNESAALVASRQDDPYSAVDKILERAGLREPYRKDFMGDGAVLDHLGVAVRSLAEAVPLYEHILGLKATGYHTVPREKTNVAMLPVGESRIELLEPTDPDSPIGRFLAKHGAGLHHVSLRVPNLEAAVARLQRNGVKLVNPEPMAGAGGQRYVFVHPSSAGGVLVELVESQSEPRPQGSGHSGKA